MTLGEADFMTDLDDADLVRLASGGDRAALGALMVRHGAGVVVSCRKVLGNSALAEDCAQDTWLLAMVRLHRLRSPDQVGAWLRGIAFRVARRALARVSPPPSGSSANSADGGDAGRSQDGMDGSEPDVATVVTGGELKRTLRRAVSELPAGQRDAVRLFYLEGRSCEESAAALNTSVGAFKVRLHKARLALRRRFRMHQPGASVGRVPSAEERAIHESGHAVLHWLGGGGVLRLSIAPVSVAEIIGTGLMPAERLRLAMPVRDVLHALTGGDAAARMRGGRPASVWSEGDYANATRIALALTGGDEVEASFIVEDASAGARALLEDSAIWSKVERSASALLAHPVLDGDDFSRLMND